jgi:hypothetical protein
MVIAGMFVEYLCKSFFWKIDQIAQTSCRPIVLAEKHLLICFQIEAKWNQYSGFITDLLLTIIYLAVGYG